MSATAISRGGEPVSAGGQIYGVKCTTFEVKLLDNQFGIAPRPA